MALLSGICLLLGWNAFRGFFGLTPSMGDINEKDKITLLTYNLHHLISLKGKKDLSTRQEEMKKVKTFFQQQAADVVGLQEISASVLNKIIDSLSYPYIFSLPENHIQILSKYPVLDGGGKLFEKSGNSYLWADIQSTQGVFRMLNIHLQSNKVSKETKEVFSNELTEAVNWSNVRTILSSIKNRTFQRVDQARELQEFIAHSPYPIILCGDFNEVPQSYIYKMLTKELSDSFKCSGWGVGTTYAGNIPGLRIDYILVDDRFEMLKSEVPKIEFSDHYPVRSILKWKGNG